MDGKFWWLSGVAMTTDGRNLFKEGWFNGLGAVSYFDLILHQINTGLKWVASSNT
jgi:hypothetical protein